VTKSPAGEETANEGPRAAGRPVTAPDVGARTYALLTDGSTVEIRHAGPQDAEAVRDMHAAMSPDNIYRRFFSVNPGAADQEARRVSRGPGPDHEALLAWLGGRLVGVASYEVTGRPGAAEIAFAVPDDMHGRGIATLLLEHLVSLARRHQLHAFTAEALAENAAMLRVFADAGLPVQRRLSDGVVTLTFPLPGSDADERLDDYLESVARRESRADVASLLHLLRPASVAVVGASRRPATVGRAILRNIVSAGYRGAVYAVNRYAENIAGVLCVASVDDLPEAVDLALIAVPPAAVPGVAQACGRRGVHGLTVITSGLGAEGAELLAICRQYGMRLIGPNCFGVSVPDIGLNATFASARPVPGVAGLVVQSGGVGLALLEQLSRLGIGVSSFASVGDKYDVSSNDLLMWWAQDEVTRLALLYVESFGSPRKFARTARRVGRRMPVLTVVGGRSPGSRVAAAGPGPSGGSMVPAGPSAARGPIAAAATSLTSQAALFGQAGVILTTSFGELIEAAAQLASQPLPAGNRVAIITNAAAGAGILTADACEDNGLKVAHLSAATRHRLRKLLPPSATVAGPVDTTAAVGAEIFRSCLEELAADDAVDAVLAVVVPTAVADLGPAVAAAALSKPVAIALLGQAESVRLLPPTPAAPRPAPAPPADAAPPAGQVAPAQPALPALPAYAYPEGAARALGHAARYRAWRDRPQGRVPDLPGLHAADARALLTRFLADHPAGGQLPRDQAASLLCCYQIPLVGELAALSEPMVSDGVEVVAGVVQEPVLGPLVVFGLGGATAEILGDHAARLTPLTDTDAGELIRSVQGSPLLFGRDGSPPVDVGALADTLLRVSRLADDLPEVVELNLSPVIARSDGVHVIDARVQVSPAEPRDPFLRRLR